MTLLPLKEPGRSKSLSCEPIDKLKPQLVWFQIIGFWFLVSSTYRERKGFVSKSFGSGWEWGEERDRGGTGDLDTFFML